MAIRSDTNELIAFLNSLLVLDRHFMQELLALRVPCNQQIAEHPSIQVVQGSERDTFIRPGEFRAGILGVLNGYCGIFKDGPHPGWGPIAAIYDEGRLIKFAFVDSKEYLEAMDKFNRNKN
jgi:hypothetical protein